MNTAHATFCAAIEKVLKNRCQSSMVSGFDYFQLGTSSMNSNVNGSGVDAVKKKSLSFSLITSDF